MIFIVSAIFILLLSIVYVYSPDEEGICESRHFTQSGLIHLVEKTAQFMEKAQMYETMSHLYKVEFHTKETFDCFVKTKLCLVFGHCQEKARKEGLTAQLLVFVGHHTDSRSKS